MKLFTQAVLAALLIAGLAACSSQTPSPQDTSITGTYTGVLDDPGPIDQIRADVTVLLSAPGPDDTFSMQFTLTCRTGCDGDYPQDVPETSTVAGMRYFHPLLRFPSGSGNEDWLVSEDRRTITIPGIDADGSDTYTVGRR